MNMRSQRTSARAIVVAMVLLLLVAASCDTDHQLVGPDATSPRPASFTLSAGLNEAKQSAFRFENIGTDGLLFDVTSSAPWLTTAPTSGDVAAGASQLVELTANCSVAMSGQHDGTLAVSTNDPDEPTFTVSVRLSCSSEPGNNAPVALDDGGYTVESGATLNVSASAGVLANDNDPDGDSLSAILSSPPGAGDLTLNDDGSFTFVHDGVSAGPHTFAYVASDGVAQSEEAYVTISVAPTGPPSIESFSIGSADGVGKQSLVVDDGEEVVLAWSVTGSNLTVRLQVRVGASVSYVNVAGKSKHHATPSASTGYTLLVSNDVGVLASNEVTARIRRGSDRGNFDLPGHDGFLTTYVGGDPGTSSESSTYYQTIGAERTLAEWIAARKDGTESAEVAAVYVNKADLGFGRDMHCWDYSYWTAKFQWLERYACYVGNYLGRDDGGAAPVFGSDPADAFEAMDKGQLVATVAMDYDESRPTGYEVQFYVYGSTGKLTGKLDLDSQLTPSEFNPQNCLACHGGSYDSVSNAVEGANFLPFDASSFAFDDLYPGRSEASQLEAFRRLNAIAYRATYTYQTYDDPTGPSTSSIRELIDLWYGGNVASSGASADFDATPVEWQVNSAGTGYETWLPQTLYHGVYRPYCRMCHVATPSRSVDMGSTNNSCSSSCHEARDFTSYESFTFPQHAASIRDAVCSTAGSPLATMPHAEVPFLDFWQSEGAHGRLQIWILRQAFEAAGLPQSDCAPE